MFTAYSKIECIRVIRVNMFVLFYSHIDVIEEKMTKQSYKYVHVPYMDDCIALYLKFKTRSPL